MPTQVTVYRVFVASPGGLEPERETFRRVLNDYNESDALEDGALYIPVGWELARAGMGRPQELINKDLRRCDYCVLVLRDRGDCRQEATAITPQEQKRHTTLRATASQLAKCGI